MREIFLGQTFLIDGDAMFDSFKFKIIKII